MQFPILDVSWKQETSGAARGGRAPRLRHSVGTSRYDGKENG
jgi:hypothetical protein